MQLQLAEIFRFHRPEGAQAHVQGGGGQLHTAVADRRQQFIAEVQARRGGRHGSRASGIAGLIPLVVAGVVLVDVGRQGNGAVLHQQRLEGGRIAALRRKLQDAAAGGEVAADHLHRQRRLALRHHLKPIAGPQLLGGFRQAEPLAGNRPLTGLGLPGLEHEQLHRSAARPARLQPCPQHPGVVHHQQVTGHELRLEVPHAQMTGMGIGPQPGGIDHQQPGRMAGLHGPLGDALLWQLKVVAGQLPIGRIRGQGSPDWSQSAGPGP